MAGFINPWAIPHHQEAGRAATLMAYISTHRVEAATNHRTPLNTDIAEHVTSHRFPELTGLAGGKNLSNADRSYYDLFIFQTGRNQGM